MTTLVRLLARLLLLVLVVAVGCAVWIAWTGNQARDELESVRADAATLWPQVSSGEVEQARTTLERVQSSAARAADLTTDPVWWLAARLPLVGDDLGAVTTLTGAADDLASDVAGPMVGAGDALDLRTGAPLTDEENRLGAAVDGVLDASEALESTRLRVLAVPDGDLVAPVADARTQVLDVLDQAAAVLTPLADLARLAAQVSGRPGG